MVFSSLTFLFLFLPVTLAGYFLIKIEYANIWLLAASIAFYYIGDKEHLVLLLGVIGITYVAGMAISLSKKRKTKTVCMAVAVAAMLALMCYYKYWNFMIENLNLLFGKNFQARNIIFPVGISFFVFQAISYVVDVYRGERALKNPVDLALYISFFPQLIAGPIVRFHDVEQYLNKKYRQIRSDNLEAGIWRFCVGLCKKVILANNLGGLADIVFGVSDISQFSVLYTWLGAIAYTLQIYYDFSGYSDMAIGLGKIFGFEFQENFNYPYIAGSVQEFWRRWHMSLSQFFRDYVYIPLGGNRCSRARWCANMMCVWFLTGLWHGASWNYILWGVLYGVILLVERFVKSGRKGGRGTALWGHVYTMAVVVMLWVLFRAENLTQAVCYLKNMFGIGASSFVDSGFLYQFGNFAILLLISAIFSMPVIKYLEKTVHPKIWEAVMTFGLVCCTVSAISYVYMGSYNPFLYFMF